MRYQPKSRLGKELDRLERLRRSKDWRVEASFLTELAKLIDREVWRPNHVRGPVLILGTLYYDRSRRTYARLNRGVFEATTPEKILFGYGVWRVEGPLLQMLVDEVSGGKKGKQK